MRTQVAIYFADEAEAIEWLQVAREADVLAGDARVVVVRMQPPPEPEPYVGAEEGLHEVTP
jgi:hypothetical protein